MKPDWVIVAMLAILIYSEYNQGHFKAGGKN